MVLDDPPPINELLAPDSIVFKDPLPMKELMVLEIILEVPVPMPERAAPLELATPAPIKELLALLVFLAPAPIKELVVFARIVLSDPAAMALFEPKFWPMASTVRPRQNPIKRAALPIQVTSYKAPEMQVEMFYLSTSPPGGTKESPRAFRAGISCRRPSIYPSRSFQGGGVLPDPPRVATTRHRYRGSRWWCSCPSRK